MGHTDISVSDIDAFRSHFNLPPIHLQEILVPHQPDPGISEGDLVEADLDLEWSGSVARNANIFFVKAPDVFTSLEEAIDQEYAPVISMSYGECESRFGGPAERAPNRPEGQREGITWLVAAGDRRGGMRRSGSPIAQDGLAVYAPGSVPEVTSMGGSEFNEGNGTFWSSTNTANGASALSYIPEKVWKPTTGLLQAAAEPALFFPSRSGNPGRGFQDGFRHVPDLSSRPRCIMTLTTSTPAVRCRSTVALRLPRQPWPASLRCSINIWSPPALRSKPAWEHQPNPISDGAGFAGRFSRYYGRQ